MRLFLALLLVTAIPYGASACDPPEPDAWFLPEIQINKLALPSSVKVEVRMAGVHPSLVVSNTSDIPIEVSGRTIASGQVLILQSSELEEALGIQLRNRREDDRPPSVLPPAGQQFLLVIIRQGQRLLLPGTIKYEINPHYDPSRHAKGVQACKNQNFIWMGIGLLVILGVAAVLVRNTIRGK